MTLRFVESFDHYNALADLTLGKWSAQASTGFGGGRFGSAKSLYHTNNNQYATKIIDSQQVWVVGMGVYFTGNFGSIDWFRIQDGGTNHITLRLDSYYRIAITRNGTLLATSPTVLMTNTWYYFELRVKIDDSAGEIETQMNGVAETLIFASGTWNTQDTRNAGNATADRFQWIGTSTGTPVYIDDIYICDGVDATATQGAPYNDFLGDCRVQCIMPSGNGNSSQLVGSDGNSTDNYLLVDETSGTFSTDYVESSTVSDKDTYAYPDISPTTGTVHAVSIVPHAAKTDAGTRKIATVARLSGGTEADSSDITLSSSYIWYPDIRTTKPGGGSWSISDVNGAEFGVKVTA